MRKSPSLTPWMQLALGAATLLVLPGCGGGGGGSASLAGNPVVVNSQTSTVQLRIDLGSSTRTSDRIGDATTFLIDIFPVGGTTSQDVVPEVTVTLAQLESNPVVSIPGVPNGGNFTVQVVSKDASGLVVGKALASISTAGGSQNVDVVLQPITSATVVADVPTGGTLMIAADTNGRDGVQVAPGAGGTFTLQVPIPCTYQFYVVVHGNIFPIYDPNQTTQNLYTITTASGNLNMGSFTLQQNGQAIASNSIVASGQVALAGENQQAPGFFTNPEVAGLTAAQINAQGETALTGFCPLVASAFFQQELNSGLGAQNDNDTANFFLAMSEVPAVLQQTQTTGSATPTSFNTLGALLDAAGAPSRGRAGIGALSPPTFPSTSPQGEDVRKFLRASYAAASASPTPVPPPVLSNAINSLNAVSSSFQVTWTPPGATTPVVSDQGDALGLEAAYLFQRVHFRTFTSYNWGGSLNQLLTPLTTQQILAANAQLLNIADPSLLTAAQQDLTTASNTALAAKTFIQNRKNTGQNFLINLSNASASNLAQFQSLMASIKADSTTNATLGPAGLTFNFNAPTFFSSTGFSLRSLLPTFNGNQGTGFFPTTFEQLISGFTAGSVIDPNHDFNGDGTADLLEGRPLPAQATIVGTVGTPPGTVVFGSQFTVVLQVQDQFGNPYTTANETNFPVTIAEFNNNDGSSLTGGAAPVSVSNGQYTFQLTLNAGSFQNTEELGVFGGPSVFGGTTFFQNQDQPFPFFFDGTFEGDLIDPDQPAFFDSFGGTVPLTSGAITIFSVSAVFGG